MFLRNAWYVAAWERDVGEAPYATTILGDRVAIYRGAGGTYGALADACPHRKVPLSMGCVQGDNIECGYHGLVFDSAGLCVKIPGNDRPPPGAQVHSYPIEPRYGLLWIWMGDPSLADPADIFEAEHWDDPAWGSTRGDDMTMGCNYLHITDNLLDPSHVAWVHPGSFAGDGAGETPLQITIADDGVTSWRWMTHAAPAPIYAPYLQFGGNCDRKQQYEVRYPSNALIVAFLAPAGTGGEDKPLHPDTFIMESFNFLTPVDESTTRYFWFQLYNVAPGDADVSYRLGASVRGAFEEDKVILEASQRGMAESSTPSINLRTDTGGIRFRRRLAQMIEAESARPAEGGHTLTTSTTVSV
jgi:phenylpropionate dioxygenase-like ring-hydroxylating dioxygenase large terminal subunit